MARPRLLDLFCGGGGAAVGYYRAGFDIVGIDIKPQPRYPFPFIQGDALKPPVRLDDFDAIHASPPCQKHTTMSNRWRGRGGKADSHESLIESTRKMLQASGKPYVIENVPGAPLRQVVMLHGGLFGLGVSRRRIFECAPMILVPVGLRSEHPLGVYGKASDGRRLWTRTDGTIQRAASSVEEAGEAMGIDWMDDWREIAESIPPAYTTFIGRQLLAVVSEESVRRR